METIIIIILALAVLYFRLQAERKEFNNAFEVNATKYMDYALYEQENKRLTAQLDQLSKDYKVLEEKYNRYHRKQGADGRFVKKGGE